MQHFISITIKSVHWCVSALRVNLRVICVGNYFFIPLFFQLNEKTVHPRLTKE